MVRFIYNDLSINPTTKILKANFVAFQNNPETDKFELSCVRFEAFLIDFRITRRVLSIRLN